MEVDNDAVYVRDSDINVRGNTLISMCYAAQKQYPGEIHGAQLVEKKDFGQFILVPIRPDISCTGYQWIEH